jgi:hypothetical protein
MIATASASTSSMCTVAPCNTTGFTEGFDTLDLKEAKALLEELAS